MRKLLPLLILALLGWPLPSPAAAQVVPPPAAVQEDTLALESAGISGRGAFLRSLVLPGWGQAYVGAPGRGGLYFALETGSLWMAYKSWRQLREARELDDWLIETGQLDPDDDASGLVLSREEQLEDWITLSIFFMLFSGADAYVSAQLADFDEHIGIRPTADGALRFQATVPLGGRR